MTHVVLVGTSHRLAPVELRERMSFGREVGRTVAARLAGDDGEAVALSTCNRTSLYVVHDEPATARERALDELRALSGLETRELAPSLYVKTDEAAALHLFRVASGLDSMVPGEAQILGQVRTAYETASEVGAAGALVHRLFRQALHAGRRVRRETAISTSPASVPSAAAELVASVFGELAGKKVLVLGAGKVGDLVLVNLTSRGATDVRVANRSPERGAALAGRFGGLAIGLDDLPAQLVWADVVIGSTGSRELVLQAEQVARARRERPTRPMFFVDLAVPRDLDPRINEVDGCFLYDVDDLERVVAETMVGRREETLRAEAIVAEEAELFRNWQLSLGVVPAIASLRALAEEIRAAELARVEGRLAALSAKERRAVESLTSQIVAKLLHGPTVRMKQAAVTAEGVVYAEAVRHLFGLGESTR